MPLVIIQRSQVLRALTCISPESQILIFAHIITANEHASICGTIKKVKAIMVKWMDELISQKLSVGPIFASLKFMLWDTVLLCEGQNLVIHPYVLSTTHYIVTLMDI